MAHSDPADDVTDNSAEPGDHTENRDTVTVIIDTEWTVRSFSPQVSAIFECEDTAIIGAPLFEYIDPEHHDRLITARQASSETVDTPLERTVSLQSEADSWSRALVTVRPLQGKESAELFVVTFQAAGTTGSQWTQSNSPREHHELPLSETDFSVWEWEIQTGRVERDGSLAEMLGYAPGQLDDHFSAWESLVHPSGHQRHDAALAAHVEQETPSYDCTYQMRTDAGDWKWIRTIGRVIEWDEAGEPIRAVGTHYDINGWNGATRVLQEEQNLLSAGPITVFQWADEPGWPITYVSENVADVLGYTPAELHGQPFAELVHEDDLELLKKEVTERIKNGATQLTPTPYRVYTADGDVRWMMEFTKQLADSSGTSTLFGYLVDISDRKQQEQKYQNLFESARDAIMVFDKDGYLDYNQRALDLFGYDSGAAFLETTPWERSPPTQPDGRNSKDKAVEYIEQAFEEGEAFFEWTHQRRDGTTFPSEVKLSRFTYEGEPVLHALIRDISDRKTRERELKEREAKYYSLFEDTQDALMLLDRDGFFDANKQTLELFGFDSVEEFVGRSPWELSPATQPDGQDSKTKALGHIDRAFDVGEAFFEWTHQRADGTTFPAEVKLSRFSVDGESALHALVRDITARKAYEAEIEELNRRFELALVETETRILEWDLETDTICWDETEQQPLGPSRESVPHTFDAFVEDVHDGDVADLRRTIDQAIQRDDEIRADFRVGSVEAGWKWVQLQGGVRYDADSHPRRVVAVLSDISDRKNREQVVAHERELNRHVQQALVESQTRAGLEDRLTTTLSKHGYALAWVGEPVERRVVTRSAEGGRRYLQGLDRSIDGDVESAPSVEAVRTGTPQFYQRLSTKDTDWSTMATQFNLRSAAAVPLVHRGVSYGVLVLYHSDPDRFDTAERNLVVELSDTLAFAIHSLDTQNTLAADQTVTMTVEMGVDHYLLSVVDATETSAAEQIIIRGTVQRGENQVIQYLDVVGGSVSAVQHTLTAIPEVTHVTVANETDPLRLQVTVSAPVPESFLMTRGVIVTSTVIENGTATITIEHPTERVLSDTAEALDEMYTIDSVQTGTDPDGSDQIRPSPELLFNSLTAKQEAALAAAYHQGYFAQPRRASATDVAETLSIAHTTFLQHLHRAEEKIFRARFDPDGSI